VLFRSTLINSLLVQYIFVPLRFEFWPIGKHAALVTLSYAAMGVLLAWFFERLSRASALSGAKLIESEDRFEATFDQAAVGIALVAPDGRWLKVNARLCEILGYDHADLLKTNFQNLTYPDDLNSDMENVRAMLAHEISTYALEKRYICKDGEILWARLTVSMVSDEDGAPSYFIAVIEDIDLLKEKQASVLRLNRALGLKAECNRIISRATSEDELLHLICREIVESAGYSLVWVGYAEHDAAKSVRPAALFGPESNYLSQAKITWSEDDPRGLGPFGVAIRSGEAQSNRSFANDPALAPWRDQAFAAGFNWASVFPLKVDGATIGALAIYSSKDNEVNAEENELLQALAVDLSYAISVQRARAGQKATTARLERSLISGLEAISYTLEMRDPYTAGHQQRVARLASVLARKMGLNEFEAEGIRLAASVHDIGKIQVPFEILTRPRRLSPLEYELVKTHAEAGYNILKGIEFPWPIANMVRQHHERVDGGGYPQGLSGDEILLGAKILAVADLIESMASHRPYRPALGVEAALAELALGRGTKYDAAVADACLALFREGYAFPE
jgi:PAS domain S-box-containing protein/putative nucleotidyltransferase with HDIG domain